MPLPSSAPITLTQIQTEFSAANLAAASTAAGLDPLPTSMLDFLGLSAYTPQTETYVTPGSYYFTVRTGKPASQVMNVLAIGGGGGGGGSIAGSGYDGEPGGNSGSSGGGGGGGAVSYHISSSANNNLVSAGDILSIEVGAGGMGASGFESLNAFGPFAGESGASSTMLWGYDFFNPATYQRIIWSTGGVQGRTANSNYRFASGKLTNGNGGDSGITTWGAGGTGGTSNPATASDWGAVDGFSGGGGGGAGGQSPEAPTGGLGRGIVLTGVSSSVFGRGGDGGIAFNNSNGANGSTYGNGGEGACSLAFYNATPVSKIGGNGAGGGVQFYV